MRKPKTWKTWTVKEEQRASVMRLEGATIREVAAALGRTLASVKHRAHRFDQRASHLGRYVPYLMRPHTLAGVASQVGVSVWAVKKAKWQLRKMGFDIPRAVRGVSQMGVSDGA